MTKRGIYFYNSSHYVWEKSVKIQFSQETTTSWLNKQTLETSFNYRELNVSPIPANIKLIHNISTPEYIQSPWLRRNYHRVSARIYRIAKGIGPKKCPRAFCLNNSMSWDITGTMSLYYVRKAGQQRLSSSLSYLAVLSSSPPHSYLYIFLNIAPSIRFFRHLHTETRELYTANIDPTFNGAPPGRRLSSPRLFSPRPRRVCIITKCSRLLLPLLVRVLTEIIIHSRRPRENCARARGAGLSGLLCTRKLSWIFFPSLSFFSLFY